MRSIYLVLKAKSSVCDKSDGDLCMARLKYPEKVPSEGFSLGFLVFRLQNTK